MFERLNTPEEAYHYKLGTALKMEHTVMEMLEKNIEHAQDEALEQLFGRHQDETREQVRNLERVFEHFGWEVDESPCPGIEGLEKEGKANVKKADDRLVDSVITQGAVETEHHEIAVYENLILQAMAMGAPEVVALLRANLEQEKHTLQEVSSAMQKLAAVKAA